MFAPNLVGAMGAAVAPDELGNSSTPVTRHDGVGGWSANAAAGVTIYLPGTAPADVAAGQTYAAVAFARAPEDESAAEGPETRAAFYTRWEGDWERYDCQSGERESFEGVRHTLWGRLDGTVTFTAVSPTRVEGTFQLAGPGTRETVTHTLDARPSGCLRHETDRALDAQAVTVSGSFVAPNVRAAAPFSVGGVGRAVPMGAR